MEATSNEAMQADDALRLAAETLRGDVRDAILDRAVREMSGWAALPEREQQHVIDRVDTIATDLVNGAVRLIAHQGFGHLAVTVGKWTVKGGLKLEVSAAGSVDEVMKLATHGPRSATLVLAEPSAFYGQRAEAVADKDQPDLPMHDADGVIAEDPLPDAPTEEVAPNETRRREREKAARRQGTRPAESAHA